MDRLDRITDLTGETYDVLVETDGQFDSQTHESALVLAAKAALPSRRVSPDQGRNAWTR